MDNEAPIQRASSLRYNQMRQTVDEEHNVNRLANNTKNNICNVSLTSAIVGILLLLAEPENCGNNIRGEWDWKWINMG